MIRQTDHTMPACDPSSCAGAVPAGTGEDRPAIFGRAHLQRFGPTSRPQAQRKPLPDTERLQRHQHGSGPAYPEYLSVAEPELASRRRGGPRDSRPDFCRGRFRRGALPSVLSRPALFGPGLSAWGRSANSVSFLAVSRGRGGRFLQQRRAVAPSPARAIACFSPGTPAESVVFGRAYVVVVGEAGCAGFIRKDESPDARPARFAETGQVRRNRRPENGDRRPLPDMRYFPVLGRLSG